MRVGLRDRPRAGRASWLCSVLGCSTPAAQFVTGGTAIWPAASCSTAEHFIALDLLHPEAVLRALLSALDELGQALGCDSIRSIVHGGRTELLDDFHVAGHAWEGVTLSKTLAGRPSV